MHDTDWRKELAIAGLVIGFGLLLLPFAIYFVGSEIVGEYAPDASALDLAEHLWADLIELSLPAWTLVLSPYLVLQLVRLTRSFWRRNRSVRNVTVSRNER
jgi:hypothetical protein